MPSPLAHVAAGYALYRFLRSRETARPQLLAVTILFSVLPDLDSLVGVVGRDFGRYHNNVSHSIGFAIGAGLLAGGSLARHPGSFWRWFSAASLAYASHLALDYWSTRRGILLFWPLSSRRFASPRKLFYGFQWGRGVWSTTHLWTAATELMFAALLLFVTRSLRIRLRR